MDRTTQWVAASRESLNQLTGPALPPKPSITTENSPAGIPYGYENVLPISQRYQQNPYSMLSSAASTSAFTCTSDEESEYLTRLDIQQNDRRKLLKLAIAQHTIIENSAENQNSSSPLSYKKRLAQSETSI